MFSCCICNKKAPLKQTLILSAKLDAFICDKCIYLPEVITCLTKIKNAEESKQNSIKHIATEFELFKEQIIMELKKKVEN